MVGIVNGNGKKHQVVSNGTTNDIIAAIYEADQISAPYTRDFARSQASFSVKDTCANLWSFVKNNVPYVEDPDGWQFIKSPGALWKARWNSIGGTGKGGDCKSMSLFVASCLQNLDIPYCYRFITETAGNDVHHVYIVAYDANGNEIYIDCVHDYFNEEIPYAEYIDVDTTKPLTLSRKDDLNLDLPTIGKIGKYHIGATQKERIEAIGREYQNNWQNILDTAKRNIEAAINDKYSRKVMDKTVREECFAWLEQCTDASDPMFLYKWWDETKAPFPSGIREKLSGATFSVKDVIELLGCSDKDVYDLASVSCWKRYGLPVSLMLEKCYAIQLYGCEFYPVPGIPYFDFNKQIWVANGSTIDVFISVVGGYPYVNPNGEDVLYSSGLPTGAKVYFKPLPPNGVPYWCNLGFLMTNGANDKDIADYVAKVPQPNVIGDKRLYTYLQADGTTATITVETVEFATAEQQAFIVELFNRYLQGQIDLPKLSLTEDKPKIGLAAAIIAAIVTAVVTILSLVASITFKALAIKNAAERAKQNPNLPANDFAFIGVTQSGGKVYWQDANGDGIKQPTEVKVYMPDGTIKQYDPATDQPVNNNQQFCNNQNGQMVPCTGRTNSLYLLGGGALLLVAGLASTSN